MGDYNYVTTKVFKILGSVENETAIHYFVREIIKSNPKPIK